MSAADALPPLTANELARLVAELRRNIDKDRKSTRLNSSHRL